MNQTTVDAKIAEIKDQDEKQFMIGFFNAVGSELKKENSNDTCSAGKTLQKFMYSLKKLAEAVEQTT